MSGRNHHLDVPQLAAVPNPFRGTVVGDPWRFGAAALDVPEIHARVFRACLQRVEDVRHGTSSKGLVIHGGAGSGKTHLIGRLRRKLIDDQPAPTLEQLSHAFAYVRLNTNALMLARHIRRALADDLLRSQGGRPTQLERMVVTRLMETAGGAGDIAGWWEYFREERRSELAAAVSDLGRNEGLSGSFVKALRALVAHEHKFEAVSWLRGEALTESEHHKLEIPFPRDDEDPEAIARTAIRDYVRLAGHKIPLVMCFDQIEALQTAPDDELGLHAFGNLFADIHDADPNLVLISCIQTARHAVLIKAVSPFAHDRLHSAGLETLDNLNRTQAELILRQRMASQLSSVRPAGASDLWPFAPSDLQKFVGAKGCSPRELLNAAADRFEVLQHPAVVLPQASREEWFAQEWAQRESLAIEASRTANVAEILAHAVPHLVRVVEPQWKIAPGPQPSDVDFVLHAPRQEARVGVMICEDQPVRLAARLKRMSAAPPQKAGLHKLVLLRDERNPIKKTARQTWEHLKKLDQYDAIRCPVAPQTLAALDAMRSLLGEAQSGDLARGAETIGPETVLEWLRRNLADSLKELADVLVTPRATDDVVAAVDHSAYFPQLQEYLDQHCIANWADAAAAIGVSGRQQDELLGTIGTRTDLFGVVTGEPTVVFSARLGSGLRV